MGEARVVEADLGFVKALKRAGGANVKKCFQCATCSAVCGLAPVDSPFPRKEMLLAAWGQGRALAEDPDIWLCFQCNDCTANCPRGAKPGDVLAAVRSVMYRQFAVPAFMGRALASPAALPLLFAVPAVIVAAMAMAFLGGDLGRLEGEIVYSKFLGHMWLQVLFIGATGVSMLLAALGLWKFWLNLGPVPAGKGPGLVPAAISVGLDTVLHGGFFRCGKNSVRGIGHLLTFYGFFGAMATAGLALVAMEVFHLYPPIPLGNPIKWLGNGSALIGLVGCSILLARRFGGGDRVGTSGYQDWLFGGVLFLTFLTGLLSEAIRLAGMPVTAYSTYYVHIVLAFFLLVYVPYSKFAHLFYRTVALVHARMAGRINARPAPGSAA